MGSSIDNAGGLMYPWHLASTRISLVRTRTVSSGVSVMEPDLSIRSQIGDGRKYQSFAHQSSLKVSFFPDSHHPQVLNPIPHNSRQHQEFSNGFPDGVHSLPIRFLAFLLHSSLSVANLPKARIPCPQRTDRTLSYGSRLARVRVGL